MLYLNTPGSVLNLNKSNIELDGVLSDLSLTAIRKGLILSGDPSSANIKSAVPQQTRNRTTRNHQMHKSMDFFASKHKKTLIKESVGEGVDALAYQDDQLRMEDASL